MLILAGGIWSVISTLPLPSFQQSNVRTQSWYLIRCATFHVGIQGENAKREKSNFVILKVKERNLLRTKSKKALLNGGGGCTDGMGIGGGTEQEVGRGGGEGEKDQKHEKNSPKTQWGRGKMEETMRNGDGLSVRSLGAQVRDTVESMLNVIDRISNVASGRVTEF